MFEYDQLNPRRIDVQDYFERSQKTIIDSLFALLWVDEQLNYQVVQIESVLVTYSVAKLIGNKCARV